MLVLVTFWIILMLH